MCTRSGTGLLPEKGALISFMLVRPTPFLALLAIACASPSDADGPDPRDEQIATLRGRLESQQSTIASQQAEVERMEAELANCQETPDGAWSQAVQANESWALDPDAAIAAYRRFMTRFPDDGRVFDAALRVSEIERAVQAADRAAQGERQREMRERGEPADFDRVLAAPEEFREGRYRVSGELMTVGSLAYLQRGRVGANVRHIMLVTNDLSADTRTMLVQSGGQEITVVGHTNRNRRFVAERIERGGVTYQ